jgi:hypothetical protein
MSCSLYRLRENVQEYGRILKCAGQGHVGGELGHPFFSSPESALDSYRTLRSLQALAALTVTYKDVAAIDKEGGSVEMGGRSVTLSIFYLTADVACNYPLYDP